MIVDAITVTDEEIEKHVQHALDTGISTIMYLKNQGISDYQWNIEEAKVWLNEDIDN